MSKFEVNILGCGAATPTLRHNPSSQVINHRERLFIVDCGEGSQLEFRRQRLKFSKINRIFISHLHGDHCFGLVGLISTLGLLGRTGELVIHAPEGIHQIFTPILDFFCKEISFPVTFQTFDTSVCDTIYEDRSLTVSTIPLKHRVPCAGFLFKEKPKAPNLNKSMISKYDLSLRDIARILEGEDYVSPSGDVIDNAKFITKINPSFSYAYCSDTAFSRSIASIIKGVDLLYHESTFDAEKTVLASETGHSTTIQAAEIAKLSSAKKLMIGHFSSRYDDETILLHEAQTVFENTILAKEGLCVNVCIS